MTLDDLIAEMRGHGLPALPGDGLPIRNGKIHRFGKGGKKAWYRLRELTLDNGQQQIVGSFGQWHGRDPGTVSVTFDWTGITDAEKAEFERRQADLDKQEQERKARISAAAAGRARGQWAMAKAVANPDDIAYLKRKQINGAFARVTADGMLLIPARKYRRDVRPELTSVQKIAPDGSKKFNTGAEMTGAACLLGTIDDTTRLIGVAEGYASGQSVRIATDEAIPIMVAFSAGNLAAVARQLRADFPDAVLVFFADDDWQIHQRYARDLLEDFDIETPPTIDGMDHTCLTKGDDRVTVRAWHRADANSTPFIEADVRCGRRMQRWKFENAGIASARAAAREVGNAEVVYPVFAARGENKWTDFNDLHVEEAIDVVRAQLAPIVLRLLSAPAESMSESPAPSVSLAPPGEGVAGAGGGDEPSTASIADPSGSPAPSAGDEPGVMGGIFTLGWALSHCALVQGSTDVWDSLNKLRMKRAAFVDMVGKDAAKSWAAHGARRTISPRDLPRTIRGVAVEDGGAGEDHIVMMLDRYTLLYGTKTVWDAYNRSILGYDAMTLARGIELSSRWLKHPLRREVDLDKLVFDPTQKVDLDTHINMFQGFPLIPKKNDAHVDLVLQLLYNLCSHEKNADEVFRWVLSWLAYPLQHPGAKMQTALLFFGEKQGTGKSLFFEGIIKPIYGAAGATGGQHQLEATFTTWRSQKLYVVFEEILSRQDKYSHFGVIKHMITGRDASITQKFKDDRTEANHLNCVMLSNEFQAVPIEPEDRRFLVVEARVHPGEELLEKIKALLERGLIEAFYAFLLEYDVGTFNEHTKPLMTPSKERVINFGRPDWEAFYLSWKAGDLAAPYCCCLSEDLYVVYSRYCNRFGFRSLSLTKFSELLAQRVAKSRQWVQLGVKKQLLTVFHVESDSTDTLSKQCQTFRDLADIRVGA
ncbi:MULTISPECIES: DUF5906 domain-containing protein [unclassified Duganella]|uniref:DUF5906 domain-containing protein n=1 Tax=unclassified Duganella TaxID=2636909 RepID=UPI00087F29C9|nr:MULTISPECIES: DUF5906 domain-containing protein [unclassified Duganella]SDH41394.1 hypothetical protein SAMN05216320_11318 [Duganella sp. OV458]SDK60907.1 hypothetical protein SAMN05428973_113145 [Duganella sp. OV510]